MANFTPLESLAGGLLIGLAAAMLLVTQGKIAGISGIIAGVLRPRPGDTSWRVWFLAGMLGSGALAAVIWPDAFGAPVAGSLALVAVAGLLVGFGTRLANGCTSGHGVCGVARMSRRSMVATATFMATGAITVALVRVLGGQS